MNSHNKRHGLVNILIVIGMLASLFGLSNPKPARADTSVLLIGPVGPEQSNVPAGQSTYYVYATNTVQVSYTSGLVTFSMCATQSCVWAIDDAANLIVDHGDDGTQFSQFLESDTHDQPAQNVTSLFHTGVNTVTIQLVDLMGPVRGLSHVLYLIGSLTPLSSPVLNIESLPTDLKYTLLASMFYSKDPVSTFTGSYTYVHTDVSIAGRGPVPSFVRTYNSSDTMDGPMGVGWTFNYAMRLASPSSGSSDIVVIGPEGRGDLFTHNGDGSYTPPSGIDTTLVKNANGTYTLTDKSQTAWSFNEAGKLQRITDRYGNQSALSYNDQNQVTSISDPAGRGNLTLQYNGGGRISQVTDWTNRTISFGYDGNSRLSTVTDRENNTTTYGYDGTSQRFTTITDARGDVVVTNTYDGQGRVSTQKDASGLVTGQSTTFAYAVNVDSTRVTTVTYPVTSFDANWHFGTVDYYDSQGHITKHVDKPVITATQWITEEYTYTGNGFRSSFKDGRGNTTAYCYDVDYGGNTVSGSRGNLTRKIEPAPTTGAIVPVTLYRYDSKNNLIETISPKGVSSGTSATCATNLSGSINMMYAADNYFDAATQTKLISTTVRFTDPDLGQKIATTTYEYNDTANPGMVSVITPPRGNMGAPDYSYAVTNTYAEMGAKAGMLITVASPLSSIVSYDYDAIGRRIKMVDANGDATGAIPSDHTWEYVYDNEDRIRFTKTPTPTVGGLRSVTEDRYDGVGNKTVEIDPLGQVTKYVYDERDNLKEVHQSPNIWTDPSVHPAGEITTTYLYDSLGNLIRTLRAFGDITYERATDYGFDGMGCVRSETQYPSWPSTSAKLVTEYSYDQNGNKVTTKDPLGKITQNKYDNLNRLTNIVYTSTTTANVTYAYDLNNNRTTMADGTGTTAYTYDELSRLIAVTTPGPKTVAYRYDLGGNRRKLIYPDQTAVNYSFDQADRLTSLTDWANRTTSYQYNIDGSLKHTDNINGTSVDYAHDNATRLTQVWNKYGSNTITQHTYTRNAAGNITRSDEVPSQAYGTNIGPITPDRQKYVEYTYDRMNRVTQEHNTLRGLGFTTNYTYDPLGNRLSKDPGSATNYTYDKADRLQTVTGNGGETITADANGNLTYRTVNGFGVTFTFDQANRMITRSDIRPYGYIYDGDGKLVKWTHATQIKSYVYDVNGSLPQTLQLTDNGGTSYKFVYGLGLAYSDDGAFGPFVYHYDGQGSMRSYTDSTRHWVMMYRDYDAFGVEVELFYDDRFAQPFKYTGEPKDDTTGYVNLRARYYDPKLGRFVSRDTFGGTQADPLSLNNYIYANDNPVNRTDHSGMSSNKVLQCSIVTGPQCKPVVLKGFIEAELARQKKMFDMLQAGHVNVMIPALTLYEYANSGISAFPRGVGTTEHVKEIFDKAGVTNLEYDGNIWDTSSYGNVLWGYQMKRLGFPLGFSLWFADLVSRVQYGWADPPDDQDQIRVGYMYP